MNDKRTPLTPFLVFTALFFLVWTLRAAWTCVFAHALNNFLASLLRP
jgi:hypothetical protein